MQVFGERCYEATSVDDYDIQGWVAGPALSQRRVALLSTAVLHRRDDRPLQEGLLEASRCCTTPLLAPRSQAHMEAAAHALAHTLSARAVSCKGRSAHYPELCHRLPKPRWLAALKARRSYP
jgi:hypothetical protein